MDLGGGGEMVLTSHEKALGGLIFLPQAGKIRLQGLFYFPSGSEFLLRLLNLPRIIG